MSKKKNTTTQATAATSFAKADEGFSISEKQALIATALITIGYYLFSLRSSGFYQQDEAAHYLSMRNFWQDPNSILGNWAKLGYKLIYAVPSLLGHQFVAFFNCLVAGLAGYFAYKVAEIKKISNPFLAFVLVATQPMWLQLTFRNYSELLSSLLLILVVFFYYRKNMIAAALSLSYIAIIRQELYPLLLVAGIFLLVKKQFVPALCLAVFPLFHNTWGWVVSGDPLYLLHETLGQSKDTADAWPRQGGAHYFLMSIAVFGGVVTTLVLVYFGMALQRTLALDWIIVVPALLYFAAHTAFNIQSIKIGPSTGGNLRYMIVITPLLAVLATEAIAKIKDANKTIIGVIVGLWAFVVGVFMSYKHNNVLFTDESDYTALLAVIVTGVILFLPLSKKQYFYAISAVSVLFLPMLIQPIKLSDEDKLVKQVVEWSKNNQIAEKRPFVASHTMFYYFYDKNPAEFENNITKSSASIFEKTVAEAPKGTIIFWDSHYGYRPNRYKESLSYEYFTKQPSNYRLIQQFITPQKNFAVLVFEKIN